MDRDLMMAVLSLHAYDVDSIGVQIGNATITSRDDTQGPFAAYSYSYNGQTIISFRSTDGCILALR